MLEQRRADLDPGKAHRTRRHIEAAVAPVDTGVAGVLQVAHVGKIEPVVRSARVFARRRREIDGFADENLALQVACNTRKDI